MNQNCYIEITLNNSYDFHTISTIFDRGIQKGFHFLNSLSSVAEECSKEVNSKEAAFIVMAALEEKEVPGLLAIFGNKANVFLHDNFLAHATFFFYKNSSDCLVFRIGVFGGNFKRVENIVDLSFYAPFFLKLCDNFIIIKIECGFYKD